uniref:SH3 domain-containing protein n=1 Tax=Heliothis virescens TaxID=7102 RepID=A0A2A4JK55_HELVI
MWYLEVTLERNWSNVSPRHPSAPSAVHVTDSSDPNWWKGYNERGEGLFPANFVTGELSAPAPPAAAAPAAPAEPAAPLRIDEAAMDAALALLHDERPRAAGADEAALARLEAAAHGMAPLVDAGWSGADRAATRASRSCRPTWWTLATSTTSSCARRRCTSRRCTRRRPGPLQLSSDQNAT